MTVTILTTITTTATNTKTKTTMMIKMTMMMMTTMIMMMITMTLMKININFSADHQYTIFTRKGSVNRFTQFLTQQPYFRFSVNVCSAARVLLLDEPNAGDVEKTNFEIIIGDNVSVPLLQQVNVYD